MTNRRLAIRAPRRSRGWSITMTNGSIVAATHAGMLAVDLSVGLEQDIGTEFRDVTASALRFNIDYRNTTATTGDDTFVACGIGWVTDRAFAAGGVALPDPSTDHTDWMFHDARVLVASRDITDIDEMVPNGHLQVVNNSMRKQRENGSKLVAIFRATILQQTQLQVFIGGRALFLFP